MLSLNQDQVDAFIQLLKDALDIVAPMKRIKSRLKPVPYMTKDWLHLRLRRNYLLHQVPFTTDSKG